MGRWEELVDSITYRDFLTHQNNEKETENQENQKNNKKKQKKPQLTEEERQKNYLEGLKGMDVNGRLLRVRGKKNQSEVGKKPAYNIGFAKIRA